MGYYLAFDGVNDYVNTGLRATPAASNANLEVDFWANSGETAQQELINGEGGGQITLNRNGLGIITLYYKLSNSWVGLDSPSPITFDERHVVKSTYSGVTGDVEMIIDGVVVATTSGTGGNIGDPLDYAIGTKSNSLGDFPFSGRIYSATLEVNGTTYTYDPSASGGTGSVLPDTTGSKSGTLVNFPTDDSQWVFYTRLAATPSNPAITNLLATSARLTWEQG